MSNFSINKVYSKNMFNTKIIASKLMESNANIFTSAIDIAFDSYVDLTWIRWCVCGYDCS